MNREIKPTLLYVISDDNYFLSHRLGLAKAAQKNGYKVTVLAYENDTKFTDKIKLHGFNFINFKQRAHGLGILDNLKLIWQTRKVINRTRPDLIHTVSMRMMFLVTIAFWISKSKRMVATLTGMGYLETASNPMIRVIKWFVTKAFKMMFSSKRIQLVVQNKDDYEGVKGNFINQERLHLVRGSGVNTEDFPLLKLPKSDIIQVTFVARMLRDKGLIELIDAAKIIQNKGINNIQINLVGMPHAVNPYSVTEDQLTHWQNQGVVKWHGFRSDIVEVWRESHIAILPSYREGLPKSLLEAASCGRAIITTDVAGCREVVNNLNGILVPVKNPTKLAEAIIDLSQNFTLINKMGLESHKMVNKYFADAIVNSKMLAIYSNSYVKINR